MLDTVKNAIEDNDGELLGRTAHALKGMARNFQIDAAAEAALELEQLAKAGTLERAGEVSRRMSAALTQFETRLKQMIERVAT
jgi:two-component system, sensor histidine kinase and response regulator